MFAGDRKYCDSHFVFESAPLCSVYERGGSAHGSPLLIFPMIPRLTLRGLDSALLLARPGYSPDSIALFDSLSGVLSCLRARSRVPPLSGTLNPALPAPLTPHHQASENPAPQAVQQRRGVGPRPSLKSSKTKAKKKKERKENYATGLTQR